MTSLLPPMHPNVMSSEPAQGKPVLPPLKLKRATSLPGKLEAIKGSGSRSLFWFRPRGASQWRKSTTTTQNNNAGKEGIRETVSIRRRPILSRSIARFAPKGEDGYSSVEYSDDESGRTDSFDEDEELFGLSFVLDDEK